MSKPDVVQTIGRNRSQRLHTSHLTLSISSHYLSDGRVDPHLRNGFPVQREQNPELLPQRSAGACETERHASSYL
jgi:hypothetical protein